MSRLSDVVGSSDPPVSCHGHFMLLDGLMHKGLTHDGVPCHVSADRCL
jgi:hypothetical protein